MPASVEAAKPNPPVQIGSNRPVQNLSEPVSEPVQTAPASVSGNGFEHISGMLDSLPDDLSEEQKATARGFIHDFAGVFSRDEFDIGRTYLIPHRINTGDNKPFRQPLRRHPLAQEQNIDDTVNKMLQHDIIEPAASPWASNVVLAKKSDGSLRFCLDYRQLNELTKTVTPYPASTRAWMPWVGVASFRLWTSAVGSGKPP